MGDLEDKTEKWWGLILEGLERDEAGNPGRSNGLDLLPARLLRNLLS